MELQNLGNEKNKSRSSYSILSCKCSMYSFIATSLALSNNYFRPGTLTLNISTRDLNSHFSLFTTSEVKEAILCRLLEVSSYFIVSRTSDLQKRNFFLKFSFSIAGNFTLNSTSTYFNLATSTISSTFEDSNFNLFTFIVPSFAF